MVAHFFPFGVLIAGLLCIPAHARETASEAAARPKAVRLEPISPWSLDYGVDRCRLMRQFGSEDDQHLVSIEQSAPQASFGLTLAGSQMRQFQFGDRSFLGLQDDANAARLNRIMRGNATMAGPAIILASVVLAEEDGRRITVGPGKQAEAETDELAKGGVNLVEAAKINRIALRKGREALVLETGNLFEPFQKLNDCTKSLLTDWGLDPSEHEAYYPPRWTNSKAVTKQIMSSYPRDALMRGEQAVFQMRAIIEKDGSVSSCHLLKSTKTEALESPACRAMMQARFEPARTTKGAAMRSFFATSISYVIGR